MTETTLPTWDEMTDLDKGAALLHAWKRDWEGVSYAIENYPAEYIEHPVMMALDPREACRHAARVTKGWQGWDFEEVQRLYDAALDASRQHCPDWANWSGSAGTPPCKCGFAGTAEECRAARVATAQASALSRPTAEETTP